MLEYILIGISFILIIIILRLLKQRETVRENMGYIFDILGISSLLAYKEMINKQNKAIIKVKEKLSDEEAFNAINYLILSAGEVFQAARKMKFFSIRELISETSLSAKTLRGWVLRNIEFGFIGEINQGGRKRYTIQISKVAENVDKYISYVESFFGSRAEDIEEEIEDPLEFLRKISILLSNLGSLSEKELNEAPEYIKNIARELGILRNNSIDYERASRIPSLVRKSLKMILGDVDEGV